MRQKILANIALALGTSLFLSGAVWAHSQPNDQPNNGGWRTVGPQQPGAPQPGGPSGDVNAPPLGPEAVPPPPGPDAGPPPEPPRTGQLTLPAGTLITVRTSQPLSSDHNQPGDGFTAVLQQPLIADGLVVARRGQTVLGTVTEAVKAGRATGVSHLGLQVGQLTLVDGQQMPVKTNLLERKGNTSVGRDAVGIGATAGVGAAVGAGVAGGLGAGVGAAAGGVLGTMGVLLTSRQPTIVYPETMLVFSSESPVTISTERSEYKCLSTGRAAGLSGRAADEGRSALRSAWIRPAWISASWRGLLCACSLLCRRLSVLRIWLWLSLSVWLWVWSLPRIWIWAWILLWPRLRWLRPRRLRTRWLPPVTTSP